MQVVMSLFQQWMVPCVKNSLVPYSVSVSFQCLIEIPVKSPCPPRPSWNGARGRGWKNLITPGEGAAVAALTNTVDHGKQSSVFPIRVVPRSLETPVSATTTPCITRFIPFYSLTPGINNDLSRSIDVDVYRERY